MFTLLMQVDAAPTVETAWGVYLGVAERAGFPLAIASGFPEEGKASDLVFADAMPSGWLRHFADRDYDIHSPMIARNKEEQPFVWDLKDWDGRLSAVQQRWRDDNQGAGVRRGLSIPTLHDGRRSAIVLCGPGYDTDPRDLLALKLAGEIVLRRMQDLMHPAPQALRSILSPRETECLRWVAVGKSDWEIGQILALSEKTINHHVENAKRKTCAATRVQAVVHALRLGAISG